MKTQPPTLQVFTKMHRYKLTARRWNSDFAGKPENYEATGDDPSYLQQLGMSLKAKGYRGIIIENNQMPYEPGTLPHPDWSWEGAIAGPDGFNGYAYVANVAQDPQGQLWVFTKAGRYRIHREEFARKLISSEHLAGLPLQLQPSGQ